MSAPTELLLRGTPDTPTLSSSTVANNAAVATSATYSPTSTGYPFADVTLNFTFSTAPTAGTGFSIYFLRDDGSGNYENGSATGPVIPVRNPDLVIPVAALTTAQRVIRQCSLPPGATTILIYNNGTGQSATSVSIVICPYTRKAPTQ